MPEPVDLLRATEILLDARHDTSAGLEARELLLPIVGAALTELGLLRDTVIARGEDGADLHERLRLIALEMHGLDGYADACEDAGDADNAAQVREIVRKVRALIPETADPADLTFAWGVRFTSKTDRHTYLPAADEDDARSDLAFRREGMTPENQRRYRLCRRAIGEWEAVDE